MGFLGNRAWATGLIAVIFSCTAGALVQNGTALSKNCIRVFKGATNDFDDCPCQELDDWAQKAYEESIRRHLSAEQRSWWERQECLNTRLSLQQRCHARHRRLSRVIDGCTRGPGSFWIPRDVAGTDDVFEAKKTRCNQQRFFLVTRNHHSYYAERDVSESSFECVAAEAAALNRTLVFDDFIGVGAKQVGGTNGFTRGMEKLRVAWQNERALRALPGVPWSEFVEECGIEGIFDGETKVVVPHDTPFASMKSYAAAPLLIRDFSSVPKGGDPYHEHQVCTAFGIPRLENAERLKVTSNWVNARAKFVFSAIEERARSLQAASNDEGAPVLTACVHVRRDELELGARRHPNLEADTRSRAILKKVRELLPKGSVVYVVSKETAPKKVFAALEEDYNVMTHWDVEDLIQFDGDGRANIMGPSIERIEEAVLQRCHNVLPTFADEPARGALFRGEILTSDRSSSGGDQTSNVDTAVSRHV